MESKKMRTNSLFLLPFLFLFISCEPEKTDKIYTSLEGIYSCEENSAYYGQKKYIIEIDEVSSQDNVFIISNFHDQGYAEFIYANLRNDSIFIQNQVISNLFVNGKGLINNQLNEI